MKPRQAVICGMIILLGMNCLAATHYVVMPGTPGVTPTDPYTNWATAGTNIIAVVNAAMTNTPTRLVWVTNGTYYPTNQIAVTNAMTIQSVNGRDVTILNGSTAGNNRCVALVNGDVFNGLTVTNYRTTGINGTIYSADAVSILNCLITGNRVTNGSGGGVYSVRIAGGTYPKMTNCIVRGNWAQTAAGGIYFYKYSSFLDCVIENNTTDGSGGGMYSVYSTYQNNTISNCYIINNRCGGNGGGIYMAVADQHKILSCVITGNVANDTGGGLCLTTTGIDVRDCVITGNRSTNGPAGGIYGANMNLRNSLIADNMANTNGGGAYIVADSTLANCTIAGNSSAVGSGGGLYQGGSVFGTNNIVYHNTAADAPNFTNTAGNSGLDYSCVTPAVDGISNIISDPAFVSVNGGNYRLTARSPCFNTGTNQDWMTNTFDLDARARILYNYVDMGCYEYRLPPAGTLFMSH